MEEKMKLLLDKIDFNKDMYNAFENAKLSKIIVSPKNSSWTIFIENENYIPVEIVKELDSKIKLIDNNTKEFNIIYNINNKDISYLLNYYSYLLELIKFDIGVPEIYSDCLKIENNKLILVVSNSIEESKLSKCIDKINDFYKRFSYELEIDIIIRKEDNVLEEKKLRLKKEIEVLEEKKILIVF